jgi:hypothetical protein
VPLPRMARVGLRARLLTSACALGPFFAPTPSSRRDRRNRTPRRSDRRSLPPLHANSMIARELARAAARDPRRDFAFLILWLAPSRPENVPEFAPGRRWFMNFGREPTRTNNGPDSISVVGLELLRSVLEPTLHSNAWVAISARETPLLLGIFGGRLQHSMRPPLWLAPSRYLWTKTGWPCCLGCRRL